MCVCTDADARAASGGLRKVTRGSFVLHASCLKGGTVGNAGNADDLDCVTLQRSDTRPRAHRLGPKHMLCRSLLTSDNGREGFYIFRCNVFFFFFGTFSTVICDVLLSEQQHGEGGECARE